MAIIPTPGDAGRLRRRAGNLFETCLREALVDATGASGAHVDVSTARRARKFLHALGRLYGMKTWAPESLRWAFLEGALAGWRPDTRVGEWNGTLHVVAFRCPIASLAASPSAACHACRTLQEAIVREALRGTIERVVFTSTLAGGDPECRAEFSPRGCPIVERPGRSKNPTVPREHEKRGDQSGRRLSRTGPAGAPRRGNLH